MGQHKLLTSHSDHDQHLIGHLKLLMQHLLQVERDAQSPKPQKQRMRKSPTYQ